jgi:ubiquinone/menaquinone biosynthesis C-methylase UbiE
MSIHPQAAVGFELGADAYERGRPSYPPEAVAWLAEQLGLEAGRTVVDLAAGTGKLTRLLVPFEARVIAIEPVDAMRSRLVQEVPGVEALAGTAERMPVPDGAADAVTVGQAFHWFANEGALGEIARVLRPGGRLGLIWNFRETDDEIHRTISKIIEPFRGDAPSAYTGLWRQAVEASRQFGPLEERSFPFAQVLDAEGLATRFGSVSVVAALPEEQREQVLDRFRALAGEGTVRLAYRTSVFVTQRQD